MLNGWLYICWTDYVWFWVCPSCFRSCIACLFIPVHVQKLFLPLVCVLWGICCGTYICTLSFLFCPTGYEWSSVPNIVYNGGWVGIVLVFCCIDGTPWTQFQSRPKWHALSTFCTIQGLCLSLSLLHYPSRLSERNQFIYHVVLVERSHFWISAFFLGQMRIWYFKLMLCFDFFSLGGGLSLIVSFEQSDF